MRSVRHLPLATVIVGTLAVVAYSSSSADASTYTAARAYRLAAGAVTAVADTGADAKAAELNASVDRALADLYQKVPGSKDLARKAKGVLVFPTVYKGGVGVGGEYGKGALRVKGKTVDYYQTLTASFGFQLGGQAKSMVFMFMTDQALKDFRSSAGWQVGGTASVALVTLGADAKIDAATLTKPVLAFVYGNKGLMYDVSVEGTKVSKITL